MAPSGSKGAFTTVQEASGSPRTKPNCVRCRNHNIKTPLLGHKRYCEFRNCHCNKCINTKERQRTMAEQIAFRRKKIQDAERRSKGLPVPDESPPPLDSEDPDTPSSSSSGFNSNNSTATNYPISTISNNSNSNISLVSSSTNISVINRPSSAPKITATTTNSNSNTNATEMLLNNKNISQQISDVPAITNNDSPNVTSENSSSDRNNGSSSSSTTNCNNVSNKYTEPVRIDAIIHLKNLLRYQIDIHALLYVILKEVKSDVREAYRRIVEGAINIRCIFLLAMIFKYLIKFIT